jgi:FkbM family methyltransferase
MLSFYRNFKELKKAVLWRSALSNALFDPMESTGMGELQLRDESSPIHFRRGTTDFACFEQIYLAKQYQSPLKIEPLTIVDAGANIGNSVRYFAAKYPKAEIWAIEPDASNFEVLKKNCKKLPRAHLVEAALWPNKDPIFFSNTNAAKWEFDVTNAAPVVTSQALHSVTIPEILARIPSGRINLLKIDIEGAERELFHEGADEWLSKVDVIVIELHDRFRKGCSKAFYSAICKRDFHQEHVGENIFIYFTPEKVEATTP